MPSKGLRAYTCMFELCCFVSADRIRASSGFTNLLLMHNAFHLCVKSMQANAAIGMTFLKAMRM